MPRSADPASRDRILDAACGLFSVHGVRVVRMTQVAAAAGCGRSVVHRHFPSKDDLVLASLQRSADRLDRSMDRAVAGLERVPSGALVAIAREVADQVAAPEFRGCPFRSYLREVRDSTDAPGRFALAEVSRLRTRVGDLVAALGTEEPDLLADRIWLVLEGLYASAPYGDRAGAATTAVGMVQELLAAA